MRKLLASAAVLALIAVPAMERASAATDAVDHASTKGGGSADRQGAAQIEPRPLRPPCRNAFATIGKRPGVVTIKARCVGRHGHKFAFGVSGWRGRDVAELDRHPALSGGGEISPAGDCSWFNHVIYCGARARGVVVLRAHFQIVEGARCKRRLSITQTVPDSCSLKPNGSCPASQLIQQLFSGLPRGC